MSTEELMKILKKEYLDSLPSKISEIKRFLAEKDVNSLQNAFHKLKGSGKTYGFAEISDIGQEIEESIKTDPTNSIEMIKTAVQRLESIYSNAK